MGRALIVLHGPRDRQKACSWIERAPAQTRVEFKHAKRTTEQNSKMWAMLSEVAQQATHHGRKYSTNDWKAIFLAALGKETRFVPSLDGESFIPIGQSSSDLSKAEMIELIEFIYSWGTQNGVTFREPESEAA